jgi:hypothetical protein
MRYPGAAAAAALAAATLALLACTSSTPTSPTPTPEASPTPAPTRTPSPSPPILGADPTSEADPYATPPPPPLPTFGAWVIDAATGTAAQLGGDANSLLSLRDSFHPSFTADGTAVWLSRSDWTDARRYALDGTLTDTIEGAWAIIESPDGRARAYYLREEDGLTSDLVAERDGASHHIEGRHALPAFSPDSRSLAYYSIGEDNVATLDVLDLETGSVRTLATDVDPCACDLTPHPAWSPSGTHLAYYDFAGNEGGNGLGGATFLVDLATGVTERVADEAPPGFAAGWLAGDTNGDRLVLEEYVSWRVSILDVTSGASQAVFESESEQFQVVRVIASRFVEVSSVIPGGDFVRFTRLFDGVTGDLLGRWDGEGSTTITPDGPAIAVHSLAANTGGCEGTLVIYPARPPECLHGVYSVAWSPDGTRLATRSRQLDGQHIGLWDPTTGHRELVVLPSVAILVGWNPQGTHLFVSDISGL